MTQPPADGDRGALLKRALLDLRDLRARLAAAEGATREPIAIVGAACRFPGGADSPEAFWRLLCAGTDATSDVPRERWDADLLYDPDPEAPGAMYVRRGGFIEGVADFDERFFGVSAREARSLDPQQRLLLEVAWEALENAGVAPDRLARSRTGVFVGISASDYGQLLTSGVPLARIDPYVGLTAYNFAPGRISYLLGLQGPSMAIDTACSSSLVAVHLACQSLRSGESDLALAGGVNLILSPVTHVLLCRARVLSPDGRCKTFDASADGYGRGEGCGVVALKRLADAQRDGDRVLAVIRGSAVNQDGPSSGLTVPNGAAQQAVVREALERAGLNAADVDYVEAHGTGTPLGDPIEVRALAAALGPGRPADRPLWLGSVKTNIGHLEACAGIAGLIKTALALRHGELPAHLHVHTPSPHLAWDTLPVRLVLSHRPWPAAGPERVAGVSSFGASGTNAHVVLSAPPAEPVPTSSPRPVELLVLSARSDVALRALADRYEHHLAAHPTQPLADVGATAATGRALFAHRLALVAPTADAARAGLLAVARGEAPAGVHLGQLERSDAPRVAFLFTGQGAQYAGMGRALYDTQPVFRRALDECDALLRPHLPRPLLPVIYPAAGEPTPLDSTEYTQPALFALEWALVALWRSWGIEPAAVLGHSVGEYVAACVAGVLGLEDALRLVALRAQLMQALPGDGAMAALFTDEESVLAALRAHGGAAAIAAINGPSETVVSGTRAAVDAVVGALAARGIGSRALTVSHAFHSQLMEPAMAPLERAAASMRLAPPRLPLVSNVTGALAKDELTHAGYYARHLRAPVRFADGIATLRAQGYALFLEIGPAPALAGMGRRCVPDGEATWLPSLRPKRDDWAQLLESLAALWVRGARVDWPGFYRDEPRRKIALPTYPFERRRSWAPASPWREPLSATAAAPATTVPPATSLLGRRLGSPALPDGVAVYEAQLGHDSTPLLTDHTIYDRVVVSGAVHLSLVASAMREAFGARSGLAYEAIEFLQPLLLPDDGARTIQTVIAPHDAAWQSFRLAGQDDTEPGQDRWTVYTAGRVRALTELDVRPVGRSIDAIRHRLPEERTGEDFYAQLWRPGEHHLGASFRVIERIYRRDGEALARLALPAASAVRPAGCELDLESLWSAAMSEVYGQVLMPAVPGYEEIARSSDETFVGQGVDRSVDFTGATHRARWVHAMVRPTDGDGDTLSGDVELLDEAGEVLAVVYGLRVRRIGRVLVQQAVERAARRTQRTTRSRADVVGGSTEQVAARIGTYLRERLAEVLGTSAAELNADASLRELGVDSLLAVELTGLVRDDLGVPLPLAELVADTTLPRLARRLADALAPPSSSTAALPDALTPPSSSTAVLPNALTPPSSSTAALPDALTPPSSSTAALPDALTPPSSSTARSSDATPPPMLAPPGAWLRRLGEVRAESASDAIAPRPRLRVFGFPHGGAGATAYLPWRDHLPRHIELHGVQLPAREERLRETAPDDLAALVATLADALAPALQPPFVFFGVSFGALLAFELTRELQRRGAPLPAHLFAAACPAPQLPHPIVQHGDMLRAALAAGGPAAVELLRRFGTMPEALLQSDALALALPALRADLGMLLGYRYRDAPPLPLPLTTYGGRDDAFIPRDLLAGWSRQTSDAFTLRALPGSHLFYRTHATALLPSLLRALDEHTAG